VGGVSINHYYNRNPYLDAIATGLAAFGAQRNQNKAIEAGYRQQAQQQLYGGLGQGLGNFVNSYAARTAHLADQATAQGYKLQDIAAETAGHASLQGAAQQAARQLENLKSANDINEAGAGAFIKEFGTTPDNYRAALIQSARTGSGAMGVPSSPVPLAPSPDEGAQGGGASFGPTAMGPPSQTPLPPQIYGETPSSIPGYKNGYLPKQYAQMAQLDQAYRDVQADPSLDPALKSAMTLRLADARRNIIPGPMPEPPKPPNAQQWIQQGNIAPIPGSNQQLLIDPQGKTHVITPTKQSEADAEYQALKLDGTAVKYKKGSSVEVKPGVWQMTDTNGNTSMWAEPQGSQTHKADREFTFDDWLKADKALETTDPETREVHHATADEKQKYLLEMREGTQAVNNEAKLAPTVKAFSAHGDSLIVAANQGTLAPDDALQYAQEFVRAFGNDPKEVPGGADGALMKQLKRISALSRPEPTVPAGPPESLSEAANQTPQIKELQRKTAAQQTRRANEIAQKAQEVARQQEESKPENQMWKRLAKQNKEAGPDDNVQVINPTGNVVLMKGSLLTPQQVAELKKNGFRIPGLE
jgi:hypothetical protein